MKPLSLQFSCVLLALGLSNAVAAQGMRVEHGEDFVPPQEIMSEAAIREWEHLLNQRGRETLFPMKERDPLLVIGNAEGNNDFRSGTPALGNSTRIPVQVNTEEAHARLLSLFSGDKVDRTPLRLADASNSGNSSASAQADLDRANAEGDAATPDDETASKGLPAWLLLLPFLGLAGWAANRIRG